MTDQLETLEDRVAAIPDTTITKGDVSVSWDGLEYTYRAFGREIDRDEALALIKALEHEEDHGGSRLFRLAASTPKTEGVIYAKRIGSNTRWYRHLDVHNTMEFYGRDEASVFTIDEVRAEIERVNALPSRWISGVWPELLSPDPVAIAPEGAKPSGLMSAETVLYKAAKEYADGKADGGGAWMVIQAAFRAGAEWQAKRITDAVEEAIK